MRLVKPELVDKIEVYLIQLAQAGRIPTPLSDDQLKDILSKLIPSKREIRIERR
jgi:programmed cell death protein 5